MSEVLEPESNAATGGPDEAPAPRPRKKKKKAPVAPIVAEESPVEAIDEPRSDPIEDVSPEATADDVSASPADEMPSLHLAPDDTAVAPDPGTDSEADAESDASTGEDATGNTITLEGGTEVTTEQVVEAILFGADTPLTAPKIVAILGVGSARDVRRHVETLNEGYAQTGAAFRIEKLAGGYQMLTQPEFNPWLKRLKQTRQDSKLSQAALETLAVVAYKQPVIRAAVEAIRGVAAGEMLNRLRELGLVKIVGRAEEVGRPLLYGTTKRFLDVFGLGSLEDLPAVEELKAPE